jgi:hypothetical protein
MQHPWKSTLITVKFTILRRIKLLSDLEKRVKALEEWRDHICQCLMYAPQAEKTGTPSNQLSSTPVPTSPPDNVLGKFPENLRQHLTFKDGKIYKKFVANELFEQMNQIAVANGYRWISDGTRSRWEKTQ